MGNSPRPLPLGLAAHQHHDGIGKINLAIPPVRLHSQVVFADIFPKDPSDLFSLPGIGEGGLKMGLKVPFRLEEPGSEIPEVQTGSHL